MTYSIYILLCSDGSYYVGHTHNLQARLETHNAGQGPRYTSLRRPVKLVYDEACASEQAAIQRERQIKRWRHAKKKAFIDGRLADLRNLSKSRDEFGSAPYRQVFPTPSQGSCEGVEW